MHWIYVLKCEDEHYYVGETRRLYRRFWEHENGIGSVNTSTHIPENIVAIYKVSTLGKFFEYDRTIRNNVYNIYFDRCDRLLESFNDVDDYEDEHDHLFVENNIVARMMMNNKSCWEKIRGGKYTRFDVKYSFPQKKGYFAESLPICHCGLPCDVRKNEKDEYLYFRCAKKNMWDCMKEEFGIEEEPCKYYMRYTDDIDYKTTLKQKRQKVQEFTTKSPWLWQLAGGHYEHCVGGCGKEYDGDNTVRYSRNSINLCFDCFIDKNDELSKKYSLYDLPKGKCLISL